MGNKRFKYQNVYEGRKLFKSWFTFRHFDMEHPVEAKQSKIWLETNNTNENQDFNNHKSWKNLSKSLK